MINTTGKCIFLSADVIWLIVDEARANLAITNPGRSRKNIIVIKRNKDPKKPPAENTHSF